MAWVPALDGALCDLQHLDATILDIVGGVTQPSYMTDPYVSGIDGASLDVTHLDSTVLDVFGTTVQPGYMTNPYQFALPRDAVSVPQSTRSFS